jgi:AcrR family transcriptional regulator
MTSVGLRERKKVETRRAIAQVALDLALQHGPDRVTIEAIAAGADVSPRTVHNYFRSRDEAILGVDSERRATLRDEVLARPAGEAPVAAIGAVLVEAITGRDDVGRRWRDRARLVADHPHLRAAQAAAHTAIEADLAGAIAARTGLPADHPYPHAVAAAALAVARVALAHSPADDPATLRARLEAGIDALADGLRPPKRP